jgi:toxin ParE1/3/4
VKLVVTRAAVADFDRLRNFLISKDADAARVAVSLLDAAMVSLTELPQRGRPSGIPGVREMIVPFGGSAYVLRYAYLAERSEIVILRVWHGREART